MEFERKERGHEGNNPNQGLTSAKGLLIELSEGRESPYHKKSGRKEYGPN